MASLNAPNPSSGICRVMQLRQTLKRWWLALAGGVMLAADVSGARIVSQVDNSLTAYEKPVLIVDGRPFYYNGVQIRADKVRDRLGWNEAQIESLFALAADAGFTVVNVPLLWSDVEPARDRFVWKTLERYVGWASKHGLKLELLWFGSNSDGEVQTRDGTPTGPLRVPDYVMNFAKVLDRDGRPITRNGLFQLDWCDPALLRRETQVLAEVMRWLAAHDERQGRPSTVVGVQIENEPQVGKMQGKRMTERSHGPHAEAAFAAGRWTDDAAFTLDVMFRYIDGVARAVKQSDYSVWTRVNCWSKTTHPQPLIRHIEAARAAGGTAIDFEGPDVYQSEPGRLLASLGPWQTGKNFLMVMENSGAYPNAAALVIVALSANAAYNVYDLCSTDNHGIYVPEGTRAAARGDQAAEITSINRLLRGAAHDLATRRQGPGGSLQTFNVLSAERASEEHLLAGVALRYDTASAGQGIAIHRAAGEWVLLSTRAATFTLRGRMAPAAVTRGHFDAANRWVEAGRPAWSRTDEGVSVALQAGEIVRLVMPAP